MKSLLYLSAAGAILLLTACSEEKVSSHYAVEKKQQMEKDLNESLERNLQKLQSQDKD